MYIQVFRGKRASNGKWVCGDLIHRYTPTSTFKESTYIKPYGSDDTEYLVDPDTVSASTGLYDKNNNMMFEGDIILFCHKPLVIWWNEEVYQWQAKIELNNMPTHTYLPCCDDGYPCDNFDLGWVAAEVPIIGEMSTEIIGNRYDNPELVLDTKEVCQKGEF